MKIYEQEYTKKVPLDYSNPKGKKIEIYAREFFLAKNRNADVITFFNGGPGLQAARGLQNSPTGKILLKDHRLVLMDQRGTGRSQKIGPETAKDFTSTKKLAEYLQHFRADNIVRDMEFLREKVLKRKKIIIMGQSFGGFVVTTYLSLFPQSVKGAMITAGIPPMTVKSVDDVYQNLVARVYKRNQEFYKAFPKERDKVRRIIDILRKQPVAVDGGFYTAERFLDSGWCLGAEDGAQQLHALLDDPFTDSSRKQVSWYFAKMTSQHMCYYETNPIYAFLHEPIYSNGFASNWAADRVKRKHGGFALSEKTPFFSGEMIRKTMFADYPQLKPFAGASEILANKNDWPEIYDFNVLAKNKVPLEVLLCTNDFYVDLDLANDALKGIANAKVWRHRTWQHDALRKHGEKVVGTLLKRLLKRV